MQQCHEYRAVLFVCFFPQFQVLHNAFALKDINEVTYVKVDESEETTLLTAPWPIGQVKDLLV